LAYNWSFVAEHLREKRSALERVCQARNLPHCKIVLGSYCSSVAEHLREQRSALERVCQARNIQVDVGELADELQRYRRVLIYPFPSVYPPSTRNLFFFFVKNFELLLNIQDKISKSLG
jgi:hypothetical protein